MTKYAEDKARFWGTPVPDGMAHYPDSRACGIYGCDCLLCLPSGRRHDGHPVSHVDRSRKLRQAKRGTPVPPGVRHSQYAYRVYRCRCDVCRAAESGARHRKANLWRTYATASWHDGPEVTTVHWPPAGNGRWTCPACGQTFRKRKEVRHASRAA